MDTLSFFYKTYASLSHRVRKILAIIYLRSEKDLWKALQGYLQRTSSTGCGYIDYAKLHRAIRDCKPSNVLECGTGVSTLIIAHALLQNENDYDIKSTLTSMDEDEGWLEMSRNLLPSKYSHLVDFKYSKVIEDSHSIFRGVRYSDIPKRNYDFVFVDGPKYILPNGDATFDFDFIYVLKMSNSKVAGLIDKRLSTVFVLQQLLGIDKVKYNSIEGLGYIAPSSRDDLGTLDREVSSSNFKGSLSLVGNSRLYISHNK